MKKLFFALGLLTFSGMIGGFFSFEKISAAPSTGQTTWNNSFSLKLQESWITIPEKATAYAVKIPKGSRVFVQLPDELWKEIKAQVEDHEGEPIPDTPDFAPQEDGWSAIYSAENSFQKLRFRVESTVAPQTIEFSFYDTRVAAPYETAALSSPTRSSGLKIISREEWGADESLRYSDKAVNSGNVGEDSGSSDDCNGLVNKYPDEYETTGRIVKTENGNTLRWPLEYSSRIEKVVVHHTASAADFNRDPQEILRAIYAYHSRSRGWGDIGYHYLIDVYGNIYEGRAGGDFVVAGHVYCSNTKTIGIALMGNFQSDEPTEEQIAALGKLLPSLAQKYELDLSKNSVFHGKNLPNLIGHRDLGATACPGENLYGLLGEIRKNISKSTAIKALQKIDRSAEFIGKIGFMNLEPRETQKVSYQFKNTGNVTWDKNTWLYVVKPESGVSVKTDPKRKSYIAGLLKETSVAPGKTGTFEVEILGGSASGLNSLEFTPVVDQRKVSAASVVQPVEISAPEWSAALQVINEIPEKSTNDKTALLVVLKNNGLSAWSKNEIALKVTANGKTYTAPLQADALANRIGKFEFSIPTLLSGRNYIFNADLLLNGKKAPGTKTLVLSFSKGGTDSLKARFLPINIARATIGANGTVSTEVKLMNSGASSWKQENIKLLVSGMGEEFTFNMAEATVAKNATARFPLSFNPKRKIGLSRYTLKLQSGNTTIPGGTGQLLVRSAIPVRPSPPSAPTQPVTSTSKIRMRLDYVSEEATIISSGSGEVQLDGVKIQDLRANEPVSFQRSGESITLGQKSGKVLRFLPPNAETILTITSWDRRPSWDTSGKINDNRFRGTLEFRVYNDEMITINDISLERYLAGLAETSNATAWEKQKVMAIIARTYAAFYMKPENRKFPGAPYDGDDSPDRFQKYLGYSYEQRSQDFAKAVQETTGKVVTYNGKLVKTPYFSQSDGRTLSAKEVWGWTDTPWLQSVPDPYSAGLERKGHGVGLSGKGAEEAAKAGKTFEEIIKYYYQGVEIGNL